MKKINLHPEIKTIPIDSIIPDAKNPRKIRKDAYKGLTSSLENFGYVGLLIVNQRNGQLVSGHQRLKVLKDAGAKEVPVVMVNLTETQQKALLVTMNNTEIMGEFTDALRPFIDLIREQMPQEFLDLKIDVLKSKLGMDKPEKIGKTLPDDLPKRPKVAKTKAGDIWVLGDHRLMCGSSLNEKDVEQLMDGKKGRLFASDPPYLVDYTGANRPKDKEGKGGGKDWSDTYHEIDIKDATTFWSDYLRIGLQFVEVNAAVYIWHAFKRFDVLKGCVESLKMICHQQIIWVKPAPIPSFCFYQWMHEPCVLVWQKGNKPKFTSFANKTRSVWRPGLLKNGDPSKIEYYCDVWELDWEGKKRVGKHIHPTQKPTEVFAIPMRVHTNEGDICYEPFSGSGTQIIAAERLHRKCFAMEIEPVFCDVAVQRWEDFTGKKATLLAK